MQTPIDAPNTVLQYKGKLTHRSWPQLPQEIVRLIATHYLWDLAVNTYCPQTWETRRLWSSRMVYTCIRDSLDLEKHVMSICPEWHRAIAKHPFWKQAVSLLDGNDSLLHHMVIHPKPSLNGSSIALPPPIYLSHHQHFRNLMASSCHVCRINYPGANLGLTSAKKILLNSMLGTVHLCREHDRRRTHFCGLCLRDTFPPGHPDPVREYEMAQAFGILENEDEDTWAGVEATCKKCRVEWLWRRAGHSPRDQEAVGGPNLQSSDWETRQCIEGFVDLAEGTIADVLTLAREKLWLKRNTKYESLGLHALAAQKTHGDDRGQEELEEEYVEEDSEEDKELMLMKDANQVRELALHDWARQRILDGHWTSPADIWYHHQVPGQPSSVQAVHPCPWARDDSDVGTTTSNGTEEDEGHTQTQHPLPAIVAGDVPPTYQLCEQAYAAHMKQMREILLHPLRNVVRKIVMECSIPTEKGHEDPGLRARRMTIEEVVCILRVEEGVWYDGVDWIERRRNEDEEERRRKEAQLRKEEAERKEKEDDEDSSICASSPSNKSTPSSTHTSSSSHSNATSPVLSTTTLQTTPSPPPLSDAEGGPASKKDEDSPTPSRREPGSKLDVEFRLPPPPPSGPRIIPVDPVRSPPSLLSSIPYIPVTTAHLPQFSMDALRILWRDACAPLYHCRCSICERAKVAEAAARAAYAAANAPIVVPSQQQHQQQPQPPVQPYPPIVIRGNITSSNAAVNIDATEIELKEVSEIELDGEGEEEVDYDASDLEYDDEEEDEDDDDLPYGGYRYSSSPEAKAEVDVVDLVSEAGADVEQDHEQAPSPRPRKRSCDELEREDAQVDAADSGQEPQGDNTIVESPFFRKHDRREHGTPPKRARLGDVDRDRASPLEEGGDGIAGEDMALPVFPASVNHDPAVSPASSPTRLRKRSSEELEDGPDDPTFIYGHAHGVGPESVQGPPGNASNKRAKVDRSSSLVASPTSPAPDLNGEVEERLALGVGLGAKGKDTCSPAPLGTAVGSLLQVEEVPAEREGEVEEVSDKPYVPPRLWSSAPHRAGATG